MSYIDAILLSAVILVSYAGVKIIDKMFDDKNKNKNKNSLF